MLVATWNVNSIKARHERLFAWLEKVDPDVVCLQELKVADEVFPFSDLADVGYNAAAFGQRTYNGVAILAKSSIDDVELGLDDDEDDAQSRAIVAKIEGVRIASLYVPNGQSVGSDKWAYKQRWYQRLRSYLDRRFDPADPILLCGDFNVAPNHADVANPEKWKESVLFHPEARAMLASITDWGVQDTIRIHHIGQGPYSWWDYRMLGFPKNDGLRIDHVLASKSMAARCTEAWVDRDERKGKKPSDHAPVLARFAR